MFLILWFCPLRMITCVMWLTQWLCMCLMVVVPLNKLLWRGVEEILFSTFYLNLGPKSILTMYGDCTHLPRYASEDYSYQVKLSLINFTDPTLYLENWIWEFFHHLILSLFKFVKYIIAPLFLHVDAKHIGEISHVFRIHFHQQLYNSSSHLVSFNNFLCIQEKLSVWAR